jgi:hypothetical protein
MTSQTPILYPAFPMVALVFFVLNRMRTMRFAAVRDREIGAEFYKTFQGAEEPEPLRVVTRHFINLFEMPMLFHVVLLMIYVTHQTTTWLVACAWLYVVLRYVHSYVHLTNNDVMTRVIVYFSSGFVLLAMWATLLVQLVRAG